MYVMAEGHTMQVQVGSTQLSNLSSDLLVVGVFGKGGRRSEAWKTLNRALGGGLESLLELQGYALSGTRDVTEH